MTEPPVTIRRPRPADTLPMEDDGRRPLSGHVLLAELDGVPLAIVAVDGRRFADDPVARAVHAVRVLLLHRGEVISDATRGAAAV
jgi:hypothetical protein